MTDEIMSAYREGIKIIKSLGKQANEDHTVNVIVRPILNILGWSMFNKTLMTKYSVKGYKGTQEVDIALFSDGFGSEPTILIEVKSLGTKFSDSFIKQLESYGTLIKKAKWLIYTNGTQWKIISNDKKEPVLEFDLENGIDDKFELLSFDAVISGKLQRYTFRSMAEKAVEKYIAEFQSKLAEDIYQHFEKKYPKDEIEEALKRLKTGFTEHFVESKPEPETILDKLNEEQLKLIDFIKKKVKEIDSQIETWATKYYFAIGVKITHPWPFMFANFHRRKNGLKVDIRYPFEKINNPTPIFQKPIGKHFWGGEVTVAHIYSVDDIEKIFPVLVKAYEFLKSKY